MSMVDNFDTEAFGDAEMAEPADDNVAFDRAAQRISRSVKRPGPAPLPIIASEEEAAALTPGAEFIDDEGTKRRKPWFVASESDYAKVPEGQEYIDTDSEVRQKPKYEGIDFTAQTLHNMAVNDKERRKALERSYPGKVKEGPDGTYIDDEGTLRKPGRGVSAYTGFGASAAAPVVGAVTGALGGGAMAGPLGGAAGAFTGSTLGQGFNDIILGLSGVYDRSKVEEFATLGTAGIAGSAGFGVGRGLMAIAPAVRSGAQGASQGLPGIAAGVLGANVVPGAVTFARELAEKGVKSPPSTWAKEAPKLQHAVEVFDPAFRTQQVLKQSAEQHFEKSAGAILKELGVDEPGSMLKPQAAVQKQQAGEALINRALSEKAQADGRLNAILERRKADLEAGLPQSMAQREELMHQWDTSQKAAQQLINEGLREVETAADAALKVAKAGSNSGDLWWLTAERLKTLRRATGDQASKMYDEADVLAGGHLPNTAGLSGTAQEFIEQLPGEFQANHPGIVKKLRDLAGVPDDKGGWIKEPVQPTFGQLHNLRSMLRANADWHTLSSDIRNGVWKFFSKHVDDALRDVESVPALKDAVMALNKADKFYADNIPFFDSAQIKATIKGLQAGEAADPETLFKTLVKPGFTDYTKRIEEMVGPVLWKGVAGAQKEHWIKLSRTLEPGVLDAKKFADQVLDAYQNNTLYVVHGQQDGNRLLKLAQQIALFNGKVDINFQPGDTAFDIVRKGRMAQEASRKAADQDPLAALNVELKKLTAEERKLKGINREQLNKDPLRFLYSISTGGETALNKILKSEDLIFATALRFGDDSLEFNLLRQAYVQQLFRSGMNIGEKVAGISPQVQQLMFPKATLDQMKLFAKEMDFLTGSKGLNRGTGSSISAFEKVENPPNITGLTRGPLAKTPVVGFLTRSALTKYYQFLTDKSTSVSFLRMIEKGLTTGNATDREAFRQKIKAHLQKGSAMGAGTGEALYQGSGGE